MVMALGARQLARRPLRYTRAALLLMLAAALGTFATAYAATWARSQTDQAAYAAPSDVRLVLTPYADLTPAALASAYRQVPGVTAAVPVIRGAVDVGRAITAAPLVAVNADTAAAVTTFPADASGGSLPGLLDQLGTARAADAGAVLQGNPLRLGVTIDAHFTAPDGFPALAGRRQRGSRDGRRDHRGRVPAALLRPRGAARGRRAARRDPAWRRRRGHDRPPPGPLRVEALEVVIVPKSDTPVFGTVDLRGLSERQSATGQDWTAVPFDPGASGWKLFRSDEQGIQPYRAPGGSPGRIQVGTDEIIFQGNPPVTYRFTAAQVDAPYPDWPGATSSSRAAQRSATRSRSSTAS